MGHETRVSGPTAGFCETIAQVEYMLAQKLWPENVRELIALTPEVAWELQQRAIPYLKLEDFYDENSLCDLGQPILSLFADWMKWVDDFVQGMDQELRQFDFRPIHLHFHFIKIFLDELVLHMFVVRQFLEKYQPSKVFYFPYSPVEPTEQMFFRESPISLMLPLLAPQYGARAESFPSSCVAQSVGRSGWHSATFRSWSALRRYLFNLLPAPIGGEVQLSRDQGLAAYARNLFERPFLKSHVFVIHNNYDVAPMLSFLRRNGIGAQLARYTPLSEDKVVKLVETSDDRWDRLWDAITLQDTFWRLFVDLDIGDLRPFIEASLLAWWKLAVPSAWGYFVQARKYLAARRPAAVITPVLWGHRDTAILAAAKSLAIKRVIYQHGGFVGTCDYWGGWEYREFANADHYLMYGDAVRGYFTERSEKYDLPRTKFHVVGSARLDLVRARRDSGTVQSLKRRLQEGKTDPLILYIADMIMGYQRGLRCASYPAVRYYEFLQRVVLIFRDFPSVRLIYKGIPTTDKFFNPIPDFIRRELPNALIASGLALRDLVWCVDAVVVDNPSTALLEALLTAKPILVYSDKRSLRLRPEAKELLEKRVLVVDEETDFLDGLRSFLAAGNFAEVSQPNDDFLKAYGTYQNDGRSAERAAETLRSFLSGAG